MFFMVCTVTFGCCTLIEHLLLHFATIIAALADEFYQLLKPYLIHSSNDIKMSHLLNYELHGIGEEHRFYRYSPGHHNYGHIDYPYIKRPIKSDCGQFEILEESILTVTFYLNDVNIPLSQQAPQQEQQQEQEQQQQQQQLIQKSSYGCTNFFAEDKKTMVYSVQPKQGDVVIFSHKFWHEGGALPADCGQTKYILRTDAMYRKKIPINNY